MWRSVLQIAVCVAAIIHVASPQKVITRQFCCSEAPCGGRCIRGYCPYGYKQLPSAFCRCPPGLRCCKGPDRPPCERCYSMYRCVSNSEYCASPVARKGCTCPPGKKCCKGPFCYECGGKCIKGSSCVRPFYPMPAGFNCPCPKGRTCCKEATCESRCKPWKCVAVPSKSICKHPVSDTRCTCPPDRTCCKYTCEASPCNSICLKNKCPSYMTSPKTKLPCTCPGGYRCCQGKCPRGYRTITLAQCVQLGGWVVPATQLPTGRVCCRTPTCVTNCKAYKAQCAPKATCRYDLTASAKKCECPPGKVCCKYTCELSGCNGKCIRGPCLTGMKEKPRTCTCPVGFSCCVSPCPYKPCITKAKCARHDGVIIPALDCPKGRVCCKGTCRCPYKHCRKLAECRKSGGDPIPSSNCRDGLVCCHVDATPATDTTRKSTTITTTPTTSSTTTTPETTTTPTPTTTTTTTTTTRKVKSTPSTTESTTFESRTPPTTTKAGPVCYECGGKCIKGSSCVSPFYPVPHGSNCRCPRGMTCCKEATCEIRCKPSKCVPSKLLCKHPVSDTRCACPPAFQCCKSVESTTTETTTIESTTPRTSTTTKASPVCYECGGKCIKGSSCVSPFYPVPHGSNCRCPRGMTCCKEAVCESRCKPSKCVPSKLRCKHPVSERRCTCPPAYQCCKSVESTTTETTTIESTTPPTPTTTTKAPSTTPTTTETTTIESTTPPPPTTTTKAPTCELSKCGGTCVKGNRCNSPLKPTPRKCTCPRGYKCCKRICHCFASGDPHYYQYDGGRRIDFMGKCKYTFTKLKDQYKNDTCYFNVEEKNVGYTRVSYVKLVDVTVEDMTFRYSQPAKKVYINGIDKTNSKFPISVTTTKGTKVIISYANRQFKVEAAACSMITSYRHNFLETYISFTIGDKVEGICGTCNGKKGDDLIPQGGTKPTNPIAFCDSWVVPDDSGLQPQAKCITPEVDGDCSGVWVKKVKDNAHCGYITDKNGPFKACIASGLVDVKQFQEGCEFDVCFYAKGKYPDKDVPEAVCENLAAFAGACAKQGEGAVWRRADFCPLKCEANANYTPKMYPRCEKTCQQRTAPKDCDSDEQEEEEGCTCKNGYLRLGNACVLPAKCGCVASDGQHIDIGKSVVIKGCTAKYACTAQGRLKKLAFPACNIHASCSAVNGLYKCKCNDRFYGDGHSCTFINVIRICEKRTVSIHCPSSKTIKIVYANYGRTSSTICSKGRPGSQLRNTDCHSKTAQAKVEIKCNGKSSCTLSASNGIFGDPCFGTYKYLEVRLTCNKRQ